MECPKCLGTGECEDSNGWWPCRYCSGKGTVDPRNTFLIPKNICPHCGNVIKKKR